MNSAKLLLYRTVNDILHQRLLQGAVKLKVKELILYSTVDDHTILKINPKRDYLNLQERLKVSYFVYSE